MVDSKKPTDFARQRLEKKRNGFQSEWNIRTERLAKLRQALAIETNAATKFQLEQQIQTEEVEIERLENQLSKIEQDLNCDPVSSTSQTSSKQEQEETAITPPQPIGELEYPTGSVSLDCPFYIERKEDALCCQEVEKTAALLQVKAPRQMGKSSLILRVENQAKKQGNGGGTSLFSSPRFLSYCKGRFNSRSHFRNGSYR